jgi:hypothetical protein
MLKFIKNKAVILLLSLTVVLAFAVRIYDISNNPPALNQDEVVNAYDAYCLGTNLADHHGNKLPIMLESFGDWASPVLTYLTVPFVKILGLNTVAIRLPVVLLGTMTVILMYFLVEELFHNKKLALLAAFLVAISPWSIALSRWAIPPSVVPFFLTLSLLLFLKAYKYFHLKNYKKYWLLMILSMLGFVLTTYSYPTMKMFIPLLLLATVAIFFIKNIRDWYELKKLIPFLLPPLLIFGLLVSPIFILTLIDPAKYNFRYAEVSIFSSNINPVILFLTNYLAYFSFDFLFLRGDPDKMHTVSGYGVMYQIESIFFYFAIVILVYSLVKKSRLWQMLQQENKRIILFLLAWLLLFPIAASLTQSPEHALRTIQALPVVEILSALGIFFVYRAVIAVEKYQNFIKIIFIGVIGFIFLQSFAELTLHYFTDYRDEVRYNFQWGIAQTFDYIKPNYGNYDQIILDNAITGNYIYVLYYMKYDPNSLASMHLFPEKYSGWVNVEKIDKFSFADIKDQDMATARLVDTVSYNNKDYYKLYDLNGKLYVKRQKA